MNTRVLSLFVTWAVGVLITTGCARVDELSELSGPYLGQNPPGQTAAVFAPGIVSTNDIDGCAVCLAEGSVCVFNSLVAGTLYSYVRGEHWTEPASAAWQNERSATDFTAGPDDRTVYFQSSRLTGPNDEHRETNIWAVEWLGTGWSSPQVPSTLPSTDEHNESFPSVASDGTVCFFTGSRDDSQLGDTYVSIPSGDGYGPAVRLGEPINSSYHELDPVISPDGSYIIFGSGRPGGTGIYDLYVTFRKEDGSWTHPFGTGHLLDPYPSPARMTLSPDGELLFYPSEEISTEPKGDAVDSPLAERYGETDTYWINTNFIERTRELYFDTECAADVVSLEYENNGIESGIEAMKSLSASARHHFELSEFLMLCGEMIAVGDTTDARLFYEALLETSTDNFRIEQGYALAWLLNSESVQGITLLGSLWERYPEARSETAIEPIEYQVLQRSGRDAELTFIEYTTRQFPESHWALFTLAEVHERRGETDQAVATLRKALELKPDFSLAEEMVRTLTAESDQPDR